ncbi:TolC family protein [Pseudohongiella sp. SYSU M77423]|uniref:TolC family protein n=1 Tax=Pseudohongiella sp. SYSU M77423 TaxID=3042312 RepID=UPI0024811C79|nr:TolC family protein [Pseudohongiella sp. SYSU M77423]MDH7944202.1 TolC family protein [Pseudohongiella sp. SYSU M77423]
MSSNDQMSEIQHTPRRSSPLLVHAICGVLALAGSMGSLAQSDNQQETEELASLMQRHDGVGRTLEDFFVASMEFSPRLEIAEEQMNIGTARREAANGQLFPQVSASASISDNRQERTGGAPVDYRGERYAVQLRQVLFDWRVFARRGQAYAVENQYEALYYAELAAHLSDVAERYFDVLQAQDALESSRAELEAVNNQLAQIERMHDLQMVQVTDLYQAQAQASAVAAEQVYLSSELELAKEALRSATGLAVGELYTLQDTTELPQIDGSLEEWVSRARANSHQIQARQYAVEAADERVSERRGNYMPQVSLVLQQQRSDLGFDNTPMARTDTGYVGLDVSIPLFAGGSNRAAVREAISQQNIARNELRQVHLDVSEQTRFAFLRLQAAERQIRAAEALLESRELSARARRRGFELGTVTTVDVLESVRDQFVAERDLQQIRYDYIRLLLNLQRDAGTLSPDDLIDISSRLQPSE